MKKVHMPLLCVILVCVLSSCVIITKLTPTSDFAYTFDFWAIRDSFTLDEQYNDYDGVPYEGVALYLVTVTDMPDDMFEGWNPVPYSDEVNDFLHFVAEFFTIPEISNGYYKFIDRTPIETNFISSASFFVYDMDDQLGYYIKFDY